MDQSNPVLSALWLAATVHKKILKKQINSINLQNACNQITDGLEPMGLLTSSNLMVGAARILDIKYEHMHQDASKLLTALKKHLVSDILNITLQIHEAKFDAITLPQLELDYHQLNTDLVSMDLSAFQEGMRDSQLKSLGWLNNSELSLVGDTGTQVSSSFAGTNFNSPSLHSIAQNALYDLPSSIHFDADFNSIHGNSTVLDNFSIAASETFAGNKKNSSAARKQNTDILSRVKNDHLFADQDFQANFDMPDNDWALSFDDNPAVNPPSADNNGAGNFNDDFNNDMQANVFDDIPPVSSQAVDQDLKSKKVNQRRKRKSNILLDDQIQLPRYTLEELKSQSNAQYNHERRNLKKKCLDNHFKQQMDIIRTKPLRGMSTTHNQFFMKMALNLKNYRSRPKPVYQQVQENQQQGNEFMYDKNMYDDLEVGRAAEDLRGVSPGFSGAFNPSINSFGSTSIAGGGISSRGDGFQFEPARKSSAASSARKSFLDGGGEFPNFENDDVGMFEGDLSSMITDEAGSQFLDADGSKRESDIFLKYAKSIMVQADTDTIFLSDLLQEHSTRRIACKSFYHVLNLFTAGRINVLQQEPYAEIQIQALV